MTARAPGDLDPEQAFEQLTARFLADPSVSEGRMFGSSGLKVEKKVFAMLVKGELVVKLPKDRVNELVASGDGAHFDPGHGRLMKEWVAIPLRNFRDWEQLADEAFQFVGSAVPHPHSS